MITGVAFVPQAPALVPALGRGLDAELGPVRAACGSAVRRACATADQVLLIGEGPNDRLHPRFARGSLAGFGLAADIQLGDIQFAEIQLGSASSGAASTLGPALTVAAHALRELAGVPLPAAAASVADELPGEVREVRELTSGDARWALVVAGDGSARRSEKAPGYLDERATAFDGEVAAALVSGQPSLLRPDMALADDLLCAGARSWARAAALLGDATWDAELLYDDAPFGVGCFVAVWTLRA